ncbi:beta-ketoacyl-[acyl-carrier-protein] synthase family protein [Microbacterium bovistercoris]|uniref:Beta-ketoacyl-[acyl-carrier-protein] synthase family protein n=1 Tax=Microbacterium bovistercoris TaxID=2293570 RepID=A0A371NXY6_9MICO|nr:beta-ketoacyl-[acyl-carrier-protein] synthase family protein [Microbacterium bovistercoris]REJ08246.1 beta-ketoacyl-[acyl-carrier-protein] synthase family protein [Microbacterium bovistercoris]
MNRHVVVTGLGAITPSGLDVPALWDSVVHGRSAITALDAPEFADLPVRIGGQVRGFDAASVLEPSLARRLSPLQHWAVAAADQAMAQAGATAPPWDASRFGVLAATGSGPIDAMQQATRALDAKGPRGVPLTLVVYGAPDAAAALLSQRYGAQGPAHGITATCASSAIGLGDALRRIRHGYADAVLVVGMEDCLNPVNLASNANLRALASGYESDPASASRPFDRARRGFVMAQGAAAILLEAAEIADARGAAPLAELAGFGESSDAHHPTAPEPQGRGAALAITTALADAGISVADIDHVNAHGTGTPAGDRAELQALRSALGEHLPGIPITATKSSTGHLLGASGAVEAVFAVQSLLTGILPPTINLDDPEFGDVDIVTDARAHPVETVLSNSFGFGGHNGALVLRRAEGADR